MERRDNRRQFRHLRRAIVGANGSVLAIDEARAESLIAVGLNIARGQRVPDDVLDAACRADHAPGMRPTAGASKTVLVRAADGSMTAVLNFRGLVNYDLEFQPYAVSTKLFAQTVNELARDSSVKRIVVIFNSPGGTVTGTPEAADALFAARQAKKVTAIVDTMAASAAYWVASQATEIVSLASGEGVGSIGVRMMHIDCSRAMERDGIVPTFIYSGEFKVEGNMFEPLGDVARARFQLECDTIYGEFLKAVARGRGVSVAEAREKFGKGRLLMPVEAKKLGMLDRLETIDESLQRLQLAAAGPANRFAGKSLSQIFDESIDPSPAAAGRAFIEEQRAFIEEQERTLN